MEVPKKLDRLLGEEKFQDDILDHEELTGTVHQTFLTKYSITERELADARRLLLGVSLVQKKSEAEEIKYGLKKLRDRVSEAEKKRKIRLFAHLSKVAAVLAVPLLLSTLYFYEQARNSAGISSSQEGVVHTYQAQAGAQTRVSLPDGSLVWLNSGSRISCPAAFSQGVRRVELKGEAYFEVVKSDAPMIVSTGHIQVRVYGTKFNLKAYADERIVTTTLVEGKVSVMIEGSRDEHSLDPGYTAFYSITDEQLKVSKVDDIDTFTGWKDGKLLFSNESFASILQKMERWYNVDIRLEDPSLGKYVLYATFIDENIEQVLDIFSKSIPIKVSYLKRVKQADGSYSKREILIERSR